MYAEPTTWDCPVLPELSFQPDFLYAFDFDGKVIVEETCKTKLNLDRIYYAIQIEVMELSQPYHTKNRTPSDEEREVQIRKLFNDNGIAIGVLWVTVAHKHHPHGHPNPNDIFFQKDPKSEEYFVPDDLKPAFVARVQAVREALQVLHDGKLNTLIKIGS